MARAKKVTAAASNKNAWLPPVLISRQSQTTFSDKEQIWADNAASSPLYSATLLVAMPRPPCSSST